MQILSSKSICSSHINRYFWTGIWNALFSLGSFYSVLALFGEAQYKLALIISFIASTFQSHVTQRYFVWKSRAPYIKELTKFAFGVSAQFFTNFFSLFFLVELLNLSPMLIQAPLALIITITFYFYNSKIVFTKKRAEV